MKQIRDFVPVSQAATYTSIFGFSEEQLVEHGELGFIWLMESDGQLYIHDVQLRMVLEDLEEGLPGPYQRLPPARYESPDP